ALGVASQQVAGAKPGVAGLEHVAEQLALRGRPVGVAVVLHGARGPDLAEQLAGLVDVACDGAAVGPARDVPGRVIEAYERYLILEQRVRLANRSDAAVEILQRDVALGSAVHLDDARDAEALLERAPHVGPQSGAGRHTEAVIAVRRRGRLAKQVPAELADVHEGHGPGGANGGQEGDGGELPAGGEGTARPEGRCETDEQALAMVQGERGVDRLALLDAEHLGEADAAHREAQVPDDGRLRVTRRARRVDVE